MRPPTACQFCRSRRRRCQRLQDGPGPCTLCQKHNVPCIEATTTSGSNASPERPRSSRAAVGSRASSSISTSSPWGGNLSSQYEQSDSSVPLHFRVNSPPQARPSALVTTHNGLMAADDIGLPPTATCLHLADLYYSYIHDQFHTLFQKPAFMADLAMGRTSLVIQYAMIALSARFSNHELFTGISARTRGVAYALKAAKLLDVSDVSLTSIQACVMLGACRIIEGDAPGESVYYGIACRMAQLLDLPHKTCQNQLERETNVRVWHTLCMVDEWSSSGVQVPRQIANPPTDVPLPMEEMAYLQLRNDDIQETYMPTTWPRTSLLAQMITLNRIFRDVNQTNNRTVDDQLPDAEAIEALSARLDDWEDDLPPFMRDDPSNLAHYAAQGLGRIYVAVYLGFYHYGQLLFYQFLHGSNEEPGSIINLFAQRCKHHAAKLCDMVYAAMDTPGCDVLYSMVGHVLVIASTVQIHTLLFSSNSTEIAAARQRLERNFNILMQLRELWPSLDYCMMRLQAFHKACRTSMETSFKLDRWMLKFLSEFAKPVEDKEAGSMDWIIGDIAITPTSDFGVNTMASVIRMGQDSWSA